MTADENTFSVSLGNFEEGTIIDYYIAATDNSNNTATSEIYSVTIIIDTEPPS